MATTHFTSQTPPGVASPLRHANSSSLFQLPISRRRRQNQILEQRQRNEQEAAVQQEEAALRAQAIVYLEDFLQNSPEWQEQAYRISIMHDAVPTMPELNAYGDLDDKEGTRACRRLFKAVVIWDELGRSLWRTLRLASEQRQQAQRQYELATSTMVMGVATPGAMFSGDDVLSFTSRRSSQDSTDTLSDCQGEKASRRGSQDSTAGSRSADSGSSSPTKNKKPRIRLPKKLSISSPSPAPSPASSRRTSCESSSDAQHQQHDSQHLQATLVYRTRSNSSGSSNCSASKSRSRTGSGSDSMCGSGCHVTDASPAAHEGETGRSAIPRTLSQNCASAVRRKLGGVFGDSRSNSQRQASSHTR